MNQGLDLVTEDHFDLIVDDLLHDSRAEFDVIDDVTDQEAAIHSVGSGFLLRARHLLHPKIGHRDHLRRNQGRFTRTGFILLRRCGRIFIRMDCEACVALNFSDQLSVFHCDDRVPEVQFAFRAVRQHILAYR